jgi:hypothetical protein
MAGLDFTQVAQTAPYLAYYRKKYGAAGVRPSDKGSLLGDLFGGGSSDASNAEYDANLAAAVQAAQATGKRRSMLADAQGVGAKGDLTDAVVQDAAARERRRRTVGVNRGASFLSPAKSLLAGGL